MLNFHLTNWTPVLTLNYLTYLIYVTHSSRFMEYHTFTLSGWDET